MKATAPILFTSIFPLPTPGISLFFWVHKFVCFCFSKRVWYYFLSEPGTPVNSITIVRWTGGFCGRGYKQKSVTHFPCLNSVITDLFKLMKKKKNCHFSVQKPAMRCHRSAGHRVLDFLTSFRRTLRDTEDQESAWIHWEWKRIL